MQDTLKHEKFQELLREELDPEAGAASGLEQEGERLEAKMSGLDLPSKSTHVFSVGDSKLNITGQRRPNHAVFPRLLAIASFLGSFVLAGLLAIFVIQQGLQLLAKGQAVSRPRSLMAFELKNQEDREISGFISHSAHVEGKGDVSFTSRLNREDFAAGIPTDNRHSDYATFSRVWRQKIHTYIASNELPDNTSQRQAWIHHKEIWGHYSDDRPLHTLALKGDSRAALAPFLAARELTHKFKWMLYGDDDTFFFMDAVANIVKDLDPDMPYFLTDHMWWTAKWEDKNGEPAEETHHPHSEAPLCVPCNYKNSTSKLDFHYPKGCPCRPEDLCQADHKGLMYKGARGHCGMPRVPIRVMSMHGGAGAILSSGLLKNISLERFEDCVTTTYSTGGDAVISVCLWQMGFGMTNPDPLWHPDGLSMFDVGREAQGDGDDIFSRVVRPLGTLLEAAAGFCQTGTCKLELDHFVTLHMRSRKFSSHMCFAEIARALANLGNRIYGRYTYVPLTTDTTLAAQYEQNDKDLDAAIMIYKHDRLCKEQGLDGFGKEHGTVERCKKELDKIKSERVPGIFITAMKKTAENERAAAREVARAFVQLMFDRYPSPTGEFGQIAKGRE